MPKTIDIEEFHTFELGENVTQVTDIVSDTVPTECQAVPCHSEECQPTVSTQNGYTVQEMVEKLGLSKRTVFRYVKHLIETWYWLPETDFRVNGNYTEFALQEALKLKATTFPAYQESVQDEHAEAVQEFEETPGVDGWFNESALATYNQLQKATSALATYDYQQSSYLTIGQQSLADSQDKLAKTRSQSFDLSNRLLTQLSLLSQDKQQQEIARQQEITADIDSYALQQAHIQLAKILKGEQLASEVDALYRKGVSPEEIGKMLNGLQSANFNGDVKKS
ncbi:MAG: hypothetical protein F6K21_09565 [Symploca sp. SIO2D2]|nr:hypothetical protein [Symploca sp. SIO2G7]NEQ65732.1 hypothetical protein [Symploca sp. SIO2D2]